MLLVTALGVAAAMLVAIFAGTRAAQEGRAWPTSAILALSCGLVPWLLIVGFLAGWTIGKTALAGAVGVGTVGVVILLVGPIVRAWVAAWRLVRADDES